jgi:hypothetical protein
MLLRRATNLYMTSAQCLNLEYRATLEDLPSDLHSLDCRRNHTRIRKQDQTKAKTAAPVTTIRPRLSSAVMTYGGGITSPAIEYQRKERWTKVRQKDGHKMSADSAATVGGRSFGLYTGAPASDMSFSSSGSTRQPNKRERGRVPPMSSFACSLMLIAYRSRTDCNPCTRFTRDVLKDGFGC